MNVGNLAGPRGVMKEPSPCRSELSSSVSIFNVHTDSSFILKLRDIRFVPFLNIMQQVDY